MKCLYVYFVTVTVISATLPQDICETCVPSENCPLFGNLSRKDQLLWMEKFPCGTLRRNYGAPPDGFASTAIGDYVCCSNNVWAVEHPENQLAPPMSHESSNNLLRTNRPEVSNNYNNDPTNNNHGDIGNSNTNNDNIEKYRLNSDQVWHPGREQNYNNKNYWETNSPGNNRQNNQNRWTNNKNTFWNERPGRQWNSGNTPRPHLRTTRPQQPNNSNFNNQGSRRNPNNISTFNRYPTASPHYPNINNNNHGNPTGAGQCDRLTSFPPDPQSGCCGREAADDDRITVGFMRNNNSPSYTNHWPQPPQRTAGPLWMLKDEIKQSVDGNETPVRIENRISGGKATEFYQYPWTVLLLTTFKYGNREASYNCGGSLISAKYVLSAGHCVYDKSGVLKSVTVNLAEYDKRTFPLDCKMSPSGRKCIKNIVMTAEDVIVHPQYENENLLNDISLIRLKGTAPYTEYIRPICLPTINIDEPKFSNLQFEVTGFGRNGNYSSNVKQSTVLHLVNQNECRRSYPQLTTKHLCAAGLKGEDTCKGDSGGPLMTLYRGGYYVAGVVSGKRADSPCGTAVPSLYTNVYHYLDWIRSNIKN